MDQCGCDALVYVDVDHDMLVEAVSQLSQLDSTTIEQTSSQYFGGEVRPPYSHGSALLSLSPLTSRLSLPPTML
jgi:hypothetical protein